MSDGISQFFPTIITAADNLIVVNYNGANGNFSPLTCMTRLLQCELHEGSIIGKNGTCDLMHGKLNASTKMLDDKMRAFGYLDLHTVGLCSIGIEQ
jgi:hypothetical protein